MSNPKLQVDDDNSKGKGNTGSSSRNNAKPITPHSPRRSWIKIGPVGRTRSVENMHGHHPSPRSKSPPLTLASGSPGVSHDRIPVSPFDTPPPKKMWESGFKSFLSKKSQQPDGTNLPEVPLMAAASSNRKGNSSSNPQNNSQQNLTASPKEGNDQSVRGGKIFQSIFGSSGVQRKSRRKTKSCNELDAPMRNGVETKLSPVPAIPQPQPQRRAQSQASLATSASFSPTKNQELSQSLRRASYAGTSSGAIVPPPAHLAQHQQVSADFHPQQHQQQYYLGNQGLMTARKHHSQPTLEICDDCCDECCPFETTTTDPYSHHPPQLNYLPQAQYPHLYEPIHIGPPVFPHAAHSSSTSNHSRSPSSATTETKKAFTEFHNSSHYARDSTSAYLGDEPSTRGGNINASRFDPVLVAQKNYGHYRNHSHGNVDCFGNGSGGRHFLSSSLPTVDENVSIHKSMRVLRPFQMVDCWLEGRRYLIGPAALSMCPPLPGISILSLTSSDKVAPDGAASNEPNTNLSGAEERDNTLPPPERLPSLFGSIVLGKSLISFVDKEPTNHYQQRVWSTCVLVLRQNYLLEYDQEAEDIWQGLPRGYAHLQYAKSYPHKDFMDALELEFYVSPCAKHDQRTLTIRLQEDREKRNEWIACLNRAAKMDIRDLYDYDEEADIGRGRYAKVFVAHRKNNIPGSQLDENNNMLSTGSNKTESACALKIIDKKEFWRRVVKKIERSDTLVRETAVQTALTTKCAKIPSFVRLLGFFETSDNVVLELELMEGMDLFQYVSAKGVLSEKEAACILRDILTVLEALNRMGVAHRDIKPANCLMCDVSEYDSLEKAPCVVKVADFGMATFVGVDGLVRGRCGTPGYVAPEIFSAGLHGGYGNKVDVFSAGVVLYVMLAGYEPFYGESDEELIAANKAGHFDFPSQDWKHVSSQAKQLVKAMMAPDPRLRLSAQEALRHPWIVQNAGTPQSVDVAAYSGVDSLGRSRHTKYDSCTIS